MKKWLRRIRGAVGMGLTWAIAWAPVGAIWGLAVGAPFVFVGLVIMGFLSGVMFSGVLGVLEGRRTLDQMSLPRFAGWGAVGGAGLWSILALIIPGAKFLVGCLLFGSLGAASAAGSLALARRAYDQDLLRAGEDVGEVGLTERETRELLA